MRRRLLIPEPILIGDIVFVRKDSGTKKYIKPDKIGKYLNDLYEPIGVVVNIEKTHVIITSLVLMSCDTPAIGDIEHDRNNTTMHYGPSMTISGIPNKKSKEEALADFDGDAYTDVLIAKRGNKDYSKWTPGNLTYFDYPAPSCCDIFYTIGTNQTDWYLPACGELNWLAVNFNIIEYSLALLAMNGVRATNMGSDRYWSSSDYGGLYAWNMIPQSGSIDYNNKQTNNYKARAFVKIML